jgi:hypothetical protein
MKVLTTTATLLALLLASTCMETSHAATICKGGPNATSPRYGRRASIPIAALTIREDINASAKTDGCARASGPMGRSYISRRAAGANASKMRFASDTDAAAKPRSIA